MSEDWEDRFRLSRAFFTADLETRLAEEADEILDPCSMRNRLRRFLENPLSDSKFVNIYKRSRSQGMSDLLQHLSEYVSGVVRGALLYSWGVPVNVWEATKQVTVFYHEGVFHYPDVTRRPVIGFRLPRAFADWLVGRNGPDEFFVEFDPFTL